MSRSAYRNNLILKGGFLIASMLGVDTRSTRDLDTSVKGIPVTKTEILKVFTEIVNMNDSDGNVTLSMDKIDDIRVAEDYAGFRIHLTAKIYASEINTKIDVSTGDTITPREISWHHHTIFNDQEVMVMAYNRETILAEKLESMVARKDLNTRLKDYYDLFLFDKIQIQNIDFQTLKVALLATAKLRGTESLLPKYVQTIQALRSDPTLEKLWSKYQIANEYARGIAYEQTCDAAIDLVQRSGI
ncbi:nucleotidyl transferase AbiEii/AbiGii toxin family protein [Lacticaseibacillus sp. N501-2]|uniref:nucleotidyl transferase AbiEii/AbiGii toxin family protein n=1 Tax=Lacticaseibacillus salsurae TaxID=3367729 RepID=UPI0038B2FD03